MTDKKLTDQEIIKALKEILELMCIEGDLQRSATISNALDLINRQKADIEKIDIAFNNLIEVARLWKEKYNNAMAENERLKEVNEKRLIDFNGLSGIIKRAKAEAYKEFAEGLKEKAQPHYFDNYDFAVSIDNIDNLLNELVGEADA